MLSHTYRFTLQNTTGQTLAGGDVTFLKGRRYKWVDGVKSYGASEATLLSLNTTLTTGSFFNGNTVDNSTDKFDGGHFTLTVTAPASSNGDVVLYLETSSDLGTTWPDAGNGVPIARLNFTASGTKRINLEV